MRENPPTPPATDESLADSARAQFLFSVIWLAYHRGLKMLADLSRLPEQP
jgi:hypothetical protein